MIPNFTLHLSVLPAPTHRFIGVLDEDDERLIAQRMLLEDGEWAVEALAMRLPKKVSLVPVGLHGFPSMCTRRHSLSTHPPTHHIAASTCG